MLAVLKPGEGGRGGGEGEGRGGEEGEGRRGGRRERGREEGEGREEEGDEKGGLLVILTHVSAPSESCKYLQELLVP